MVKRLLLVAIVVAAILVVAAPALAFSGYRADWTTAAQCQVCHPDKHAEWMTTAHSSAEANHEPITDGARCAGCHSGNYDPQKAVPISGAGTTADPYVWSAEVNENGAFSENMIGCSTCHYGGDVQHAAPASALANADICGQCHSRQGNSKPPNDKYPLASPTPGGTINPQYPIGYKMLGEANAGGWTNAMPLTDIINVPTPAKPVDQIYYTIPGETTTTVLPYTARTHEEGALQYQEWANGLGKVGMSSHANALVQIKAYIPESVINQGKCLECHSQDYRMAPDDAKPTAAEAKYGITCTSCHDPHAEGAQSSVWNPDRNPQLTAPRQELCVECHNAELGPNGIAKAGQPVHHPMKEMMNGTGAIDVPQGSPSVHKGKCVQCHMPPTGRDRVDGRPATAGNHVFAIIEPALAVEAITSGNVAGKKWDMYNSACTTCHSRPGDSQALWLQETLDNRQEAMHAWNDQVTAALTKAAKRLGFKSTAAANTAINKIKPSKWSKGQRAFQKSFTNQYYIQSEGSWGIHNWDYARTVILKALEQAKSVRR